MLKIKKLLVASSAIAALVFSASICASAAQIDSLSRVDNTIYASATADNARLYAVEYDEGLLVDAFFADVGDDGNVELKVGEASEYTLYLWDRESLAPISVSYNVIDGVAYAENSTEPVPAYEFSSYSFNQEDDVMIVSAISEAEIKGFKAGVETTYALTDDVVVVGLSEKFEDVVPGSVVLIGTNKQGDCAAIELLASIGIPVNPEGFEADYGIYNPSDGSTKYRNILTEMFSKSGSKVTTYNLPDTTKTTYYFETGNVQCYRVGIAMNGETPVITYTNNSVSASGLFENTSKYHHYMYLRFDTEKKKTVSVTVDGVTTQQEVNVVTQCVFYCVPKDFNPTGGDDEYSPIFGLEPIVIIK